ncbi:MAG: efflux RND transporter periplasmic adaptor subunit [Pseudomonadota bacterium]
MTRQIATKTLRVTLTLCLCLTAAFIAGCFDDSPSEQAAPDQTLVRGLRTVVVRTPETAVERVYPGVLDPAETTDLSFELSGKLQNMTLSVGQRVAKGTVIARLDDTQYQTSVANARSALREARVQASLARKEMERKIALRERGVASQATADNAIADHESKVARVEQAEQDLENRNEDLTKTVLRAPFDGIVSSVSATSFTTVSAGQTIASMYSATKYETSFSVNFDMVNQLQVGKPAVVRLSAMPDVQIKAEITELGDKASSVSSFPVTVTLTEDHPLTKAGMAVEVAIEIMLEAQLGYKLPLSVAINDTPIMQAARPNEAIPLSVYVFDPESSTVKRRQVKLAGVRDNQLLIVDGLKSGERVASAGVSFLSEGMKVKLLQDK